jgi:hypothetical protein
MQRINKPAIYSGFGNEYPAGDLPYRRYRRKRPIGQSQHVGFVHFIGAIMFRR